MATTVGTETTLGNLLEDLIQLDYDAADAYQAAIDRLDDRRFRDALAEFKRDHLRHIAELSDILSGMGRTPPKEGDMKGILAKGKVVIGGLMGDESICMRCAPTRRTPTPPMSARCNSTRCLRRLAMPCSAARGRAAALPVDSGYAEDLLIGADRRGRLARGRGSHSR